MVLDAQGWWRRLLSEADPTRRSRTTCRPRGSSSHRAVTRMRSVPRRWPSSPGRPRWARSRFHPWPVRSDDVDHPDELRIDPQPADFADAVRVAGEARVLLDELGYTGFPKTSGGRGPHLPEDRATLDLHRRSPRRNRLRAAGEQRVPGQVTTKWWKEERGERVFVDYNQNARDRTIASAWRAAEARGAGVAYVGTASRRSPPRTSRSRPCPPASPRSATVAPRRSTLAEAAGHVRERRCRGCGERHYPPDYPKMPGEPKRVQPSRDRDRRRT